jgi:hypothetical protein
MEADWGYGLNSPVAYREPYLGCDPPAGEVTIMPRCKYDQLVLDRLRQTMTWVGGVRLLCHMMYLPRRERGMQRLGCKLIELVGIICT